MRQASLVGWVKVKKLNISNLTYRFLISLPEFMLPDGGTAGPFREGDLVSGNALPKEVWDVLLYRGAVEPYQIKGVM